MPNLPQESLWTKLFHAAAVPVMTIIGARPSVVSTRNSCTVISPFIVSSAFLAKVKGSTTLFATPSQSMNSPHFTSIVPPFLTNFSIAVAPSVILFFSRASLSSVISFLNLPKNHSRSTAPILPMYHSLFIAILRDLWYLSFSSSFGLAQRKSEAFSIPGSSLMLQRIYPFHLSFIRILVP